MAVSWQPCPLYIYSCIVNVARILRIACGHEPILNCGVRRVATAATSCEQVVGEQKRLKYAPWSRARGWGSARAAGRQANDRGGAAPAAATAQIDACAL